MKAVGVILILAASVCVALLKGSSLRRHCRELESFCCFLRIIKDGCRYSYSEVSDIVSNIPDSSPSLELSFIKLLKENKVSLKELGNSSSASLDGIGFCDEDKEHIASFFAYLGTTDREGQLDNCARHLDYFEKRYADEKQQLPSKVKVFSSLSFCGSAVLALILI